MKKQQSGFTLIELIMVIVVLGILAAFALPRFADFGADARKSALDGIAGSLRSASAIAHSAQLAAGTADNVDVTLEGQAIDMVDGYPTANATGIILAAQVSGISYDAGGAAAGDVITFTPDGGSSTCQVTYTAAKKSSAVTAEKVAQIAVTATSCD
ncbi:Fimbrial protein precursor [compost metagenome]